MDLKLLEPIKSKEFFDDIYEKKHLHIERDDSSFFHDVLTLKQVDDVIFSTTLIHPQIRIANDALEEFPDAKSYTVAGTNRIDPIKFVKAFAEGSTLVMSGLQEKIYSLRKFSNTLESIFGHKFQTNIYLTPKNSQGFPPHYDTHDVFVMQIEGEKSWRIYENTLYLADTSTQFVKGSREPGAIVDEFVMKPGDTLYIPRGVMHDANTTDTNSLHVTTGLLGRTWAEHLSLMLSLYSKEIPALRKYTKFHRINRTQLETELGEVKQVVGKLISELLSDDLIQTEFQRQRKPTMKGMLNQVIHLNELSLTSKVCLSEPENLRTKELDSELELKFYDIKVNIPDFCQGFINSLMSNPNGIKISEIDCELDDDGMITLSKELVNNGILTFS